MNDFACIIMLPCGWGGFSVPTALIFNQFCENVIRNGRTHASCHPPPSLFQARHGGRRCPFLELFKVLGIRHRQRTRFTAIRSLPTHTHPQAGHLLPHHSPALAPLPKTTPGQNQTRTPPRGPSPSGPAGPLMRRRDSFWFGAYAPTHPMDHLCLCQALWLCEAKQPLFHHERHHARVWARQGSARISVCAVPALIPIIPLVLILTHHICTPTSNTQGEAREL